MLAKLKRIDWYIVLILSVFMIISSLLIYSATVDVPKYAHLNFHVKNFIYYGLGFLLFMVVSLVDYRLIMKFSWYAYGLGILLLLGLYKWGVVRDGAIGWYQLPGNFDFQPAEFMKLALIMVIASFMGLRQGESLRTIRDVIPIGLIVFVPFILVFQQPDLGNAVIYLAILLGMLWIGNVPFKHALIGTVIAAVCIGSFYYLYQHYHDPIEAYLQANNKGHWVKRIDTFLNPEQVDKDARFHLERAQIAIGSGSLMGDGYLKGDSIHNNFVPVAYSDAIFVVVAEEFGFVGSAVLLMLLFSFLYRMILIALQSNDRRGSFVVIGIVSMYVFQIFQNIGMWFGLLPVTGITLPFISYGGTSLLINMVSIAIVISVQIHQDTEEE
ncbi:FtsW/RodA/SpoVE family cell cycle protein [Paenibacillus sp. J2TS4]|uniref:FtsW/RodA/SpoVE family cell cycle protein n=1 Tax=Paenibacillus sp. J2TS4 TaxID=2807194 RepID=UPI001B0E0332|nr:FtsW/RodA/SpoVE family cell cycle protein [Paenibacillus sp. J2TS4]GIP31368.1 rod shape-determining protein RodA [Paenibacillus sp. J2TS4]